MTHDRDDFRLPQNVRPKKYIITIEPDFKDFTFSGVVRIDLEILESTSRVVLNAVDLEIKSASISQEIGEFWGAVISLNNERETLTLDFPHPLKLGWAKLEIDFTGTLNDKLVGFYRSKYTLPDGTDRFMATTQFEATDARRAFPCFDEPAQKATFGLKLTVPKDRVALSNMPVEKEMVISDTLKQICFKQTPVMSTYLLAFIVGDLEVVEGYTKSGALVRVFATPGKKEQCAFALDVGVKALEYFEDYFNIPFPLPKLDMAAIPDFASGAMENWGLITFRELALLVDPTRSSSAARQRVAQVIAHEIAHMWFGNLVTMKWWNDLWLNESFASFMGDKAVDHLFPDWHVWERFYLRDTVSALSLDGLKSSHPIEVTIDDPHTIDQIFDLISYSKGASVLRMLESFLGEGAFRRGVSQYLKKHAYGNAKTQDLWDALEEISGKTVGAMMDTWTKQTGYPVIEVARSSYRKVYHLTLRQRRFFYDPSAETEEDKVLWKVPVTVTAAEELVPIRLLLDEPEQQFLIAAPSDTRWVKLNGGQTGFFRVQYSPKMQEALYPPLERRELSELDRVGLVSDAYALQKAGIIPATQFLELAGHLRNEGAYSVWSEVSTGMLTILSLLSGEPYYPKLEAFAREIFLAIGEKVGWDPKPDEGELDPLLRSLALGQLGRYGDEQVIEEARQRFALLCLNPKSLNPNLRMVACNIAAMQGSAATYDALLRLYRAASLKEEQMSYLQAMGFFKDKNLLRQTLTFALSPEVRHENTVFGIMPVSNNDAGRDLAWEFLKERWEELHERFAHSKSILGNIIQSVVSGLKTQEKKEDVERFFQDNPVPEASMALAQSLERVAMNIAWITHNRALVDRWLKERK